MKPIINIVKGGKPVTAATIERAKKSHMVARGWTDVMRDDAMVEPTLKSLGIVTKTPRFEAALRDLLQFEYQLDLTYQINSFNAQLAAYRTATARLARYPLAQGRVAIFEDQPTGEVDAEGNPVTQSVLVAPQIDPLPATIERDVRDHETGDITGTEEIPNPAIAQDEAERAAAQAVVDGTPQDVKDFDQ